MSKQEILQSIELLSFEDKVDVIEKAVKSLHQSGENKLSKAAAALFEDYKSDKALTSFTSLDVENFYEAR